MLIIGSRALQYYAQERGVPFRSPGDTDVICSEVEMLWYLDDLGVACEQTGANHYVARTAKGRHMEFEIATIDSSGDRYLYEVGRTLGQIMIAPLDVLLSIKKSHLYIPRKKWKQHMQDYHLMKSWGVVDTYSGVTKLRRKEHENLKTPSLNKTADEFFDDHVSNKTFIHDEIHTVMAHQEKPMFEYIKVDPALVKCSKDKFWALTPEQRIQCVLEEAYVIALERGIIPMLFEGKKVAESESAFDWALFRICTTLTSGWFREFAAENWPAIREAYDRGYATKFLTAVDEGKIRRIKP